MNKRIYIETYGCQMNDYESDRTSRRFHQLGYERTDNPELADLVLYNTCSIRDKADQKATSSIGLMRSIKTKNPNLVIAVGGCLAQSQGDEIQKRFPYVDIVFGTHQWPKLPELVEKAFENNQRILELDLYGWRNYSFLPYFYSEIEHPVSELITIQNGCNKFCSFCLVPFTRGREVSRDPADILAEVETLTEQGVREVTLLGQNVNAYGKDRKGFMSFARLLKCVAEVEGLRRIRFITSHPSELTHEIIDTMANEEKICEHLHLPLQSGSDRVLRRMGRDYDRKKYRQLVDYLRKRIPNISLTTDIIVAFPGETEGDFQETLNAASEFEFDDSFSFTYSPRPNTKALHWAGDQIAKEIADERLERFQTLQSKIRTEKNQRKVGRIEPVLVEGTAKKGSMLCGKTRSNHTVNFDGPSEWVGETVDIEITDSVRHTFKGRIASGDKVH